MSETSTEVDTEAFGEDEEIYAVECEKSSALFLRCINKVPSWECSYAKGSNMKIMSRI